MNRRSFIKGCCGGLAGLIVGCEPVLAKPRGGIVKKPYPCLLESGEAHLPNGWARKFIAGGVIMAGEIVSMGADGKPHSLDRQRRHIRVAKGFQIRYSHA